ncbi:FAD:protein FMN transferase [Acholeplasma hippikon]|uniref:FAD:protein FMN transferase n=1 Tax=Acholeplasma hippikon TaxID=264636 RepID=A0A449BKJ4_9MOLU|nr:FAD:protein FMN transferase [Acholeplasma hippikon]VEU82995.1 Thiamine biosynthesis lipoprotein ApbE precursor [Acholeplasma hippikon]
MKKGLLLFNLILLGAVLLACEKKPVPPTKDSMTFYAMDTQIVIDLTYSNASNKAEIYKDIEDIYMLYDEISDNFRKYPGVHNVYYINEQADLSEAEATVEITKELYDLIDFAYYIQKNSNGYFDIAIGKIIDIWKSIIEEYEMGFLLDPDAAVEWALKEVEKIDIIEDPIKLFTQDNKYFITLKKGAKIDLGAVAKGYTTQKAIDYLKNNNIENYLINGGTSSLALGVKTKETPNFNIGLVNPLNIYQNYGIVRAKNTVITTSGSNMQKFETSDGTWYHHIVSPKTKKPENIYYAISIIGEGAGLMDAYSTALFSMPLDEVKEFLKNKDIEFIAYQIDQTIEIVNPSGRFTKTGN